MENRLLRQYRTAHVLGTARAATVKQAATPGQRELLAMLGRLGWVGAGTGALYGVAKGMRRIAPDRIDLGSGSNVPAPISVMDMDTITDRNPMELGEPDLPQPQRLPFKAAAETFNTPLSPSAEGAAGLLPEPDNSNVLAGKSIPLTLAAAALPAYGAYKGVGSLFNRFRKSTQEKELEDAKNEYEQTLADQYRSVMGRKTAEAAVVADGIDMIFEKSAGVSTMVDKFYGMPPLSLIGADPVSAYGDVTSAATSGALGINGKEGWNSLKGLTAAAALAAGLGTGKYMYDRSKKTAPENVMREAVSRRSRQRRGVPSVLIPQLMNEQM